MQNLNWLEDIKNNEYINVGNKLSSPKYVGFFNIDHSSVRIQQNKKFLVSPVQKYMVKFPGIEDYFFAAVKQGQFLS